MKKTLLFLMCAIFASISVYGAGISDDETKLGIPTITGLHQDDPDMHLKPSAYELESATLEGINTITKYLKDADGNIIPIQYDIKYKTAGDSQEPSTNPSNNYYYKWDNTSGHKRLIPTANESDADIVIYLAGKAASRMTSIMSGGDLSTNYAGLSFTSDGGAIYNGSTSTIGNIAGSFIGNYINASNYGFGGAIYNSGKITGITGDFIGNYIKNNTGGASYGGAIYNSGTIGPIVGNFIGNYIENNANIKMNVHGGAILNTGKISGITGDFIGNYILNVHTNTAAQYGGAISNQSSNALIEGITGDFIGNYLVNNASLSVSYGGAIYNIGTIGNIMGDFIDNYIIQNGGNTALGGAIYNEKTIGNITGDFINNGFEGRVGGSGGAIYNSGTVGDITGSFIENYGKNNTSGSSRGGAVYNSGTIGDITGDFINNSIEGHSGALGGAIYNYSSTSKIGDITGSFIGNKIEASSDNLHGGAVYNSGTIGNITGDFIRNSATKDTATLGTMHGGAIYNIRTITEITGSFIENYIKNNGTSAAHGGAIDNGSVNALINAITGDFIRNGIIKDTVTSGALYGGAIHNLGTITEITGNFIENYIKNNGTGLAYGGAIHNSKTIASITGNFIGNYIESSSNAVTYGGAMCNIGTIGDITGDFIGNYAKNTGTNAVYGGVIYNNGTIGNIAGNFIGNYIEKTGNGGSYGGAISNNSNGLIKTIIGDFVGNYVEHRGTGASSKAYGGAIYNTGAINEIIDSSFIDNYVQATTGDVKGGAIYTSKTINIIAKDKDVVFSGNHTDTISMVSNDAGATQEKIVLSQTPNAIHMYGNNILADAPNLNLNVAEDKVMAFYDSITSEGNNNIININKPGSSDTKDPSESAPTGGMIILNADMSGFGSTDTGNEVNFYDGTMRLGKDFDYFGVPINVMAGGSQLLDISNNQKFDVVRMNKFILNNKLNLLMDVDLQNKMSDTFAGLLEGSEKMNLVGFNIMTHTWADTRTDLLIADADAMGKIALEDAAKTAYTPIYKYDVSYNDANGILTFMGGKPKNIDSFNPSVLDAAVAAETGALFAQLASYQHGFKTLDTIAYLNSFRHRSMSKFDNKLASAQNKGMVYIPQKEEKYESTNLWYQPYTVFESVRLRNGPKVSNIEYGSYFGGDSELFDLKNGWQGMIGGYGGYNGSHQAYQGVGIYQNGGKLGLTGSVFKNDFYSGITANVGALCADADTMYGKDNFATLLTGIAVKSGYNFHSRESKVIFQPSMLVGYSFIKTFDYKAASGVNMHSLPINAITLAPELRLIMNLKNNWQPYISVSGWWNIMGESKFRANNVSLPEMATKPYIQYGIGVQKFFTDRLSGFFQTMIRNGGRTGIGLNFGINYELGKKTPRL